jgi:hypothetical protein
MIRKSAWILVFAAALLFVGTGCDTLVTLDKPNVTYAAINDGAALRLTWGAVTDAKEYEIKADDTTFTATSSPFDVTTPTKTIEVRAVNGNDKSDPATIDCKAVVTASIDVYGISDPDPLHASGFGFTADGTGVAYSLANDPASVDFYIDDGNFTPFGFVNPGDHVPPFNAKLNTAMDAGTTNFDAFDMADSTGYISQLAGAVNGVYALWLSTSAAWTVNDHFAKAKVVAYDAGTTKATLKFAYQKIGGLRWLMN